MQQNQKPLKEIRNDKKIGQEEIANFLGVSKAHYCNLENGKRRMPLETAQKIAEFLKEPIEAIIFPPRVSKMQTQTSKAS